MTGRPSSPPATGFWHRAFTSLWLRVAGIFLAASVLGWFAEHFAHEDRWAIAGPLIVAAVVVGAAAIWFLAAFRWGQDGEPPLNGSLPSGISAVRAKVELVTLAMACAGPIGIAFAGVYLNDVGKLAVLLGWGAIAARSMGSIQIWRVAYPGLNDGEGFVAFTPTMGTLWLAIAGLNWPWFNPLRLALFWAGIAFLLGGMLVPGLVYYEPQ